MKSMLILGSVTALAVVAILIAEPARTSTTAVAATACDTPQFWVPFADDDPTAGGSASLDPIVIPHLGSIRPARVQGTTRTLAIPIHGWNGDWSGDLPALADALWTYGPPGTDVASFDWSLLANWGLANSGLPPDRDKAQLVGRSLACDIAALGYDNVLLVPHSLGTWVADAAADRLKSLGVGAFVQIDFLDPYVGAVRFRDTSAGDSADAARSFLDRRGVEGCTWIGGNFDVTNSTDLDLAGISTIDVTNVSLTRICRHAHPIGVYIARLQAGSLTWAFPWGTADGGTGPTPTPAPGSTVCQPGLAEPTGNSFPALTPLTIRATTGCGTQVQARVVGGPYGADGALTPRFTGMFTWASGLWGPKDGEQPVRIELRAFDASGRAGNWTTVLYIGSAPTGGTTQPADTQAPTIAITRAPACTAEDPVILRWDMWDDVVPESRLDVSVALDGGPFVSASQGTKQASYPGLAEGDHTATIRVGDGTNSSEAQARVRVDRTPPIVTGTATAPRDRRTGFFADDVALTSDATDPGGCGVQRLEYSMDGGATWIEGDEVRLEGSGIHQPVLFRAIDLAANVSKPLSSGPIIIVRSTITSYSTTTPLTVTDNVNLNILGEAFSAGCVKATGNTSTLVETVVVAGLCPNVISGNTGTTVNVSTGALPPTVYFDYEFFRAHADALVLGDLRVTGTGGKVGRGVIFVDGNVEVATTGVEAGATIVSTGICTIHVTGSQFISADVYQGAVFACAEKIVIDGTTGSTFEGRFFTKIFELRYGTGVDVQGAVFAEQVTITGTANYTKFSPGYGAIEVASWALPLQYGAVPIDAEPSPAEAPNPPSNLYPTAGKTVTFPRTFSWGSVPGALAYEWELSWAGGLLRGATVEPSVRIAASIPTGPVAFRVRAAGSQASGPSSWSEVVVNVGSSSTPTPTPTPSSTSTPTPTSPSPSSTPPLCRQPASSSGSMQPVSRYAAVGRLT